MFEITGNLFDHNATGPDAVCITTNGFVNRPGRGSSYSDRSANTMGCGCALKAKQLWPGIQVTAGQAILKNGNICQLLTRKWRDTVMLDLPKWAGGPTRVPYHILTFPVKPVGGIAADDLSNVVSQRRRHTSPGDHVPGWACVASPKLIEKSAHELVALADKHQFKSVVLPRPGCGAGELDWVKVVRPLLQMILNDRFWVITFPKKK